MRFEIDTKNYYFGIVICLELVILYFEFIFW